MSAGAFHAEFCNYTSCPAAPGLLSLRPDDRFRNQPGRYAHWKLDIQGAIARLSMNVAEDKPFRDGYRLKLNSYDLGVDIELSDVVQRLRFEHPEVRVVVLTSANPRIFSAGANIQMLGTSSHPFKVNFCKYTNETRCSIEDASAHSGQKWIAALNGTSSGAATKSPPRVMRST